MLEQHFTIRQIETFHYSAKFLSITKAAKKLYMSTPSAWKHIKNIEAICKKPLFRKIGKKLELTATGRMLANEVLIFLDARTNLSNVIHEINSREQQPIQLSITNTFQNVGFNLIQPFIEAFPNIRVDFTLDRWSDQSTIMAQNKHDFYMISDPFAIDYKLAQKKLLCFEYVLVASSKHPLSQCKRLTAHNICHSKYLSTHTTSITQSKHNELFKKWGMKKKPIYVDSYLAAKEATKANLGIAILPKCIIEDELASKVLFILPMEIEMIKTPFILIYKASKLDKGSHELFFNHF